MKNLTERQVFPDFLKAFLIYMVVLGHSLGLLYRGNMDEYWNNGLITFIYSFHMPLFIAVSGFFLGGSSKKSLKDIALNKTKRLIVPICTIAFVTLVALLFSPQKLNAFLSSPIKGFYDCFTAYWYLDCLFALMLIVGIFKRWTIVIGLCLLLVYEYLPYLIFKDLQIVRQLFIFYFAYVLGQHKVKSIEYFFNYKYIILSVSLVAWAVIIFVGGINLLHYPCWLRILVGLASSISMLVLVNMVYDKIKNKNIGYLQRIGMNSLGIYILHVFIIQLLPSPHNTLLVLLLSVVLLVISSILTDFCRKTLLKKLLLGEF